MLLNEEYVRRERKCKVVAAAMNVASFSVTRCCRTHPKKK